MEQDSPQFVLCGVGSCINLIKNLHHASLVFCFIRHLSAHDTKNGG